MQDTALVGSNLDVLDHGRVGPDGDAVVREARSARNLLMVRAPPKACDLAAGINGIDASTCGGVPEVNVAIIATASCGEQIVSPRAPREGLDGSSVVGLLELGRVEAARIPDADKIVVATGSQLVSIRAPFEAADFASVAVESSNFVVSNAYVVIEDPAIPGTRS
jgi:hypothetical protein